MTRSLGDFLKNLEKVNQVVRISETISSYLEITEFQKRLLDKKGPALIFEKVISPNMKPYTLGNYEQNLPLVANLFATDERVALGLGLKTIQDLRGLGKELAQIKNPQLPKNLSQLREKFPLLRRIVSMRAKEVKKAPCQEVVLTGADLDLGRFPIQTLWPGDAGPLITWGAVVTKGQDQYNIGIYRLQVIAPNKLIVRWLKHRGGADHYRQYLGQDKMPVAVFIGADPATLLSAVMPIPETLSEYNFSGLIRKKPLALVSCKSHNLLVPAEAEIVLEGWIDLQERAMEGPFGDHTGFYNEAELFPVMTLSAITTRHNPYYLSTFTGKPPDEPSVLGAALNEVFVPLIQEQFPEIVDFWLPPEACSYRIALVSIKKSYPGQARRIMMGVWSYLRQFSYTKFIIVLDHTINIRSWEEVIWTISTHMDFCRDLLKVPATPIDYLDFASQEIELGGKLGFDATTKIYPETKNPWGRIITQNQAFLEVFDKKWLKHPLFKDLF